MFLYDELSHFGRKNEKKFDYSCIQKITIRFRTGFSEKALFPDLRTQIRMGKYNYIH